MKRTKYERYESGSSVFEKTYKDYLGQVGRIDLFSIEQGLGTRVEGTEMIIPLFGKPYRISERDIIDPSGEKPSFDICVILFKYMLLCPDGYPEDNGWVSFRDFKDSGPLTAYFSHEVEEAISEYYSGRINALQKNSEALGGYPPNPGFTYDVSMEFKLLPRVPILMLFNDRDDEFPAKCSVLYEKRAENYLDAECLAIAGRLFLNSLKDAEVV